MKNLKTKRFFTTLAVAGMALAVSATTSHADIERYGVFATASAQVGWDSLSISGTGTLVNYTGISPYSWSRAGTFSQYLIPNDTYDDSDFKNGIVYTSAQSQIGSGFPLSAYGSGVTDVVPSEYNMITDASAFADSYLEEYSAIGTAPRGQYFQVTGSGTLTFSIDYELTDIYVDSSAGGKAWAKVMAWSFLRKWTGTGWDDVTGFVIEEQSSGDIIDYWYSFGPETGTLSFNYAATAGEYLHFGAGSTSVVSVQSTVPVPGAVWLFGTGLVGIIAIRRKSSQ